MSMLDDIVALDERNQLYLSAVIADWSRVHKHDITAVIDLDADVDAGVPSTPNQLVYIYFPIEDGRLPDVPKLHSVARFGADLIRQGYRVLSHCGLGLNRSALVAGLILTELGMPRSLVVPHLRSRRPGALYNELFARYLQTGSA
jgi:protein-tyrosine phosphatase